MLKGEAIKAIQRGEKVTHQNFSPDEFMEKGRHGGIQFEDGVQSTLFEFFRVRTGESWETGYSIFKATASEPKKSNPWGGLR